MSDETTGTMPRKVACANCPCKDPGGEYDPECQLGYPIQMEEISGIHQWISDNCQLVVVRFAGGEFRPELLVPEASPTPESDNQQQEAWGKLDEICEWLRAGAPGAQREKIMQSIPADTAREMCHKLMEAANVNDMDGCALCGS